MNMDLQSKTFQGISIGHKLINRLATDRFIGLYNEI